MLEVVVVLGLIVGSSLLVWLEAYALYRFVCIWWENRH